MASLRKPFSVLMATALAVLGLTGLAGAAPRTPDTGAEAHAGTELVQDTQSGPLDPGPFHRRLDPLVGEWKAVKYNWILGSADKPVVSRDITVRTRWITRTGGRFLEERTTGTLGGTAYFREGILGFSNIDRRYEWTTFDSVTPTAMTYRGPALTEGTSVISIPGEFTDPGILGPEYLGRTIPMRTVITIAPDDRHTFDLYFTPPGQAERLVDRVIYTKKLS
ncbi:DUF1579 family protein [Streptomyces sp. NPDC046915]|uniref:DUF1579 family protein n=1 Tax=Streptomyces sp. NPDC046915 TaxID=3155257 RepID=UPI0033C46808